MQSTQGDLQVRGNLSVLGTVTSSGGDSGGVASLTAAGVTTPATGAVTLVAGAGITFTGTGGANGQIEVASGGALRVVAASVTAAFQAATTTPPEPDVNYVLMPDNSFGGGALSLNVTLTAGPTGSPSKALVVLPSRTGGIQTFTPAVNACSVGPLTGAFSTYLTAYIVPGPTQYGVPCPKGAIVVENIDGSDLPIPAELNLIVFNGNAVVGPLSSVVTSLNGDYGAISLIGGRGITCDVDPMAHSDTLNLAPDGVFDTLAVGGSIGGHPACTISLDGAIYGHGFLTCDSDIYVVGGHFRGPIDATAGTFGAVHVTSLTSGLGVLADTVTAITSITAPNATFVNGVNTGNVSAANVISAPNGSFLTQLNAGRFIANTVTASTGSFTTGLSAGPTEFTGPVGVPYGISGTDFTCGSLNASTSISCGSISAGAISTVGDTFTVQASSGDVSAGQITATNFSTVGGKFIVQASSGDIYSHSYQNNTNSAQIDAVGNVSCAALQSRSLAQVGSILSGPFDAPTASLNAAGMFSGTGVTVQATPTDPITAIISTNGDVYSSGDIVCAPGGSATNGFAVGTAPSWIAQISPSGNVYGSSLAAGGTLAAPLFSVGTDGTVTAGIVTMRSTGAEFGTQHGTFDVPDSTAVTYVSGIARLDNVPTGTSGGTFSINPNVDTATLGVVVYPPYQTRVGANTTFFCYLGIPPTNGSSPPTPVTYGSGCSTRHDVTIYATPNGCGFINFSEVLDSTRAYTATYQWSGLLAV